MSSAAHPRAGQQPTLLGGVNGWAGRLPHQGGILFRAWGWATEGSPDWHMHYALFVWAEPVGLLWTDPVIREMNVSL